MTTPLRDRSSPSRPLVAWSALAAILTLSFLLTDTGWAYPPFRQRQQEQLERQRQLEEENEERNEPPAFATPAETAVGQWLDRLDSIVPQKAADFGGQNLTDFTAATDAAEQWAAEATRFKAEVTANQVVHVVGTILEAKDRVEALLNRTLAARTGFAALDAAGQDSIKQREAIHRFLVTTTGLIDLSARLRYLQFDLLNLAVDNAGDRPLARERLLDELIAHRSSMGALTMIGLLFDPPADETKGNKPAAKPNEKPKAGGPRGRRAAAAAAAAAAAEAGDEGPAPIPAATKRKLMRLIAVSGEAEMVADLVDFIREPKTPPDLVVDAVETIRQIGLPQDWRPGQDPEVPKPAITARELYDLLAHVPREAISYSQRSRMAELLTWLDGRARQGVTEGTLRMGPFDVRPGDWLLMRNPSPYNLFTDLSPGLFTHVGVVAEETGKDGIRRLVLVDLPERGTNMPATNVDAFVARSMHFVFLRHPDPAVARAMADTAATLIGCPTEFDLNFRTDRVTALKGQPLAGKKIHTYCAGFLLLCAQATNLPREEFFPVPERGAGGHTQENLAKLGISIGDQFISPTGALFSGKMQIVGRREPMYDPQREVEEAIYDHFADSLAKKELVSSPDLFQSLRLKMAEAAKGNPLLTQAIADAAHVDKDMDLVSAAKAQAVVETLDDIATGNSRQFLRARLSIILGPNPQPNEDSTAEQLAQLAPLRKLHADLAEQWDQRKLTPRRLRLELVKYYIAKGDRELDTRFFGGEKQASR